MKRWLTLLLGLLFTVATLAYALNGVDFGKLRDQFAQANYLWLVPCFALGCLGMLLRALRWRAILNRKMTLGHSFNIMNVGYLFNALLPLRLGEVARAYLSTRLQPPLSIFTTLSTIVVERLTDMLAVVMLFVIAVSMVSVPREVETAARITGIIGVSGLLFLAVLAARRGWAHGLTAFAVRVLPFLARLNPATLLDRLLDGLAPLATRRGAAEILFWTALSWTTSIIAGYVLMLAFYPRADWTAALLFIAIASLAIALPAVPGSVGPFEAAIVAGLAAAGFVPEGDPNAKATALAFAVVLHVANLLTYASLGYIGLLREKISIGQIIESARSVTARKVTSTVTAQP